MVTFTPVGRFGNFLFEAASCIAYALDYNLEYSIPATTRDAFWHPIYLPHLINPKFEPALPDMVIQEKGFKFQRRNFHPDMNRGHNIRLDGYWQSEKYFQKYREQIIKLFGYPWESFPKKVSVHVRRGDYLTTKKEGIFKHPPVTADWYRQQMAKFPESTFAFFSDDIQWCKDNFRNYPGVLFDTSILFHGKSWLRSATSDKPEERDLVLMSCCEHHICSASTFSFWGAWLNQNPHKRVIMPKHWITPGWDNNDYSDVVPANWERA